MAGKVYKTVDDCNVVVGPGGTLKRLSCEGAVANAAQLAIGGWKDKAWIDEHPDWTSLYCSVNFC